MREKLIDQLEEECMEAIRLGLTEKEVALEAQAAIYEIWEAQELT